MRCRGQGGDISLHDPGTHVVLLGFDVAASARSGLLGFAVEREVGYFIFDMGLMVPHSAQIPVPFSSSSGYRAPWMVISEAARSARCWHLGLKRQGFAMAS
jgi:hypothetical protein